VTTIFTSFQIQEFERKLKEKSAKKKEEKKEDTKRKSGGFAVKPGADVMILKIVTLKNLAKNYYNIGCHEKRLFYPRKFGGNR
jgi:hypothetical protein